jgi:hypothetical protein
VHIWRQIRPATKLTRMSSIDDLFKGRHFDQEIINLRFKLTRPAGQSRKCRRCKSVFPASVQALGTATA